MEKKLYCLKDNLKGQLDNIYIDLNDRLALRAYANIVNDPKSGLLFTNIADFAIYSLGTLDTDTGVITSDVQFVSNAIDLKETA